MCAGSWCADAATPTISTATHRLLAIGASIVGTIRSAAMSIVTFRPLFTDQPRLMKAPDSHPPNTDPTSAIRYDDTYDPTPFKRYTPTSAQAVNASRC